MQIRIRLNNGHVNLWLSDFNRLMLMAIYGWSSVSMRCSMLLMARLSPKWRLLHLGEQTVRDYICTFL